MSRFELVHSGEDYFSRLRDLISNAQKEIHFHTYIFDNDNTGIEIAEVLKKAAIRKVAVYILLDGYGSASLSNEVINDLTNHGVQFRYFSPLFSTNNFYLGRRLHHKIVVADAKVALVGGINIANKYRGDSKNIPWLDYAIQVEDEIAQSLQELCKNSFLQKRKFRNVKIPYAFKYDNHESLRILRNDWLKRKNEIGRSYLQAIKSAQKEIIIVGSYFLPGRRLLKALNDASGKRGVKIKLILSGISDVPFVRYATRYMYSSLLNHGIELYEWKASVLHGKVALIDNRWSTIGSFNLNRLSLYGSIELNIEVISEDFSKTVNEELNRVIAQCDQITLEQLQIKETLFSRFKNWFSYKLVRLASILVTYFPKNGYKFGKE